MTSAEESASYPTGSLVLDRLTCTSPKQYNYCSDGNHSAHRYNSHDDDDAERGEQTATISVGTMWLWASPLATRSRV